MDRKITSGKMKNFKMNNILWKGCHTFIRVQNPLASDVCSNIVIYTLHDLNNLTTDQGACEAVICIPIGTMDDNKSNTNSSNLNQRTGLSPDSTNAQHLELHVKKN